MVSNVVYKPWCIPGFSRRPPWVVNWKKEKLGKQNVSQLPARLLSDSWLLLVFEPQHIQSKSTHSFVSGLGHLKVVVVIIT